jgi:general secretion pathway protein D
MRYGPSLRLAGLLGIAVATAGCASGALSNARRAEQRQDFDGAVVEYARALGINPDNTDASAGLERAKVRASLDHYARGRQLAALSKLNDALGEFQIAAEMNPASGEIRTAFEGVQNQLRANVTVDRGSKTELEALVDRTRDLVPGGHEMPPAASLPDSLVFRSASSLDAIIALARMANVNVIFDPAFRPQTISLDVRGQTFDQALEAIGAATQTFYRVTAPGTVTVIPDTPAKRREYEEDVVKTFYLSNADPKEAMDLLRVVIDARRMGPTTATNAITIRDTAERVAAAGRLINAIDKARPEVVVDVELLEVDRARLNEFGLQPASPGSAGIDGVADVNRSDFNFANLSNLRASDVLLLSVPALDYRLLKSDAATRVLADPQLRISPGGTAQARFGDRVPVPVTTFSPIATGGVAQQPITSYNYENIGVNIDLAPSIHMDNAVTLALKISVTSILGTGFGGLPTFGNREVNTQIRLKDGETNMLAGLIRDDEQRQFDGIPGISDLPLVGHLFGHTNNERDQTDVIVMITPHIVRVLGLTENDLRPFAVGRDSVSPNVELLEPPREPTGNRPPPPSSPVDLTGTWGGDLATLPGTPQMTWTLTESGTNVNGSVMVALPGFVLLNGTLTGTLTDATLTYTITVPAGGVPVEPTCTGQLTGTAATTPTALNGTASLGTSSCPLPISTLAFALSRR